MYIEINPITEKDDLKSLKIDKINWDVVVNDTPYQIVRIEDRPHGEGGKWGINEYYAYPLNEEMSIRNLAGFWGNPVNWGISFEEHNSSKTKWNHTSINSTSKCIITRNGKPFYYVPAREMHYGLAKAQSMIPEFNEHPLSFIERDWNKKCIGNKIWYDNSPAIIQRADCSDGRIYIVPDGIDKFPPTGWRTEKDNDFSSNWYEYEDGLYVEYLSEKIFWFRK